MLPARTLHATTRQRILSPPRPLPKQAPRLASKLMGTQALFIILVSSMSIWQRRLATLPLSPGPAAMSGSRYDFFFEKNRKVDQDKRSTKSQLLLMGEQVSRSLQRVRLSSFDGFPGLTACRSSWGQLYHSC